MQSQIGAAQSGLLQRSMQQVYLWMTAGLLITGAVSTGLVGDASIMALVMNPFVFIGLFIVQLLMVIGLSAMVQRLSPLAATMIFLAYAALNGVTLTPIFLAYTAESIASTFFTTAGTFAVMAVYGATTKRDLTKLGSMLMMAVIGLIIATLVNLFFQNSLFNLIISVAGVLIFVGLTAYDVQKLTRMSTQMSSADDAQRFAVIGALTLYLDFINLFIYMLRLLGVRRD
ncbi:MAG: Bax inhibitor-1/YccA family protein [Roseiflexaceae bacterium]